MIDFCDSVATPSPTMSRRSWLRIGSMASLGMLANPADPSIAAVATTANRSACFGKAKSIIFVFVAGGQSQIDMWDPKPDAPSHVRGDFRALSTAVPGLAFTEHMPQLAQVADRLTIVRSLSHEDLEHGSATYLTLTGRYHPRRTSNPPVSPADFPSYGAVLKKASPQNRFLFDAVNVNGPVLVPFYVSPGQNGGFLGRRMEPVVIGDVTERVSAFPGLGPRSDLPTVRIDERQSLKSALNQFARDLETNQRARDLGHLYRQAEEMLADSRCREAFDLEQEPVSLRERYGQHRSGQSCLLARRLVEAGVPLITVFWNHSNRGQDRQPDDTDWYGWDTHNDIFAAMKKHLLPRFDESFSALIADLDQRGLLDETLVVCLGEFGRAPRIALEKSFIGTSPGRKHWSAVYSGVFAGAGVQRGAVVGESDRFGAEPATERIAPWDVAATMFNSLGVQPTSHFSDALNRPFAVSEGVPIKKLFTS